MTSSRSDAGVGGGGEPSEEEKGDQGGELPGESHVERLQREHEQLFHELRAVIPGAQILLAFLLTVAFTNRFTDLSEAERVVYFVTFVLSAIALVLLLAPTAFHRIRFRQGDKDAMIRLANVEALAAMALLSFTIAGTVYLIGSVVYSTELALVAAVCCWLLALALWCAVPLARFTRETSGNAPRGRSDA